ncbi:MAG: PDZ domain-containing protein, partial [Xanthomonadales bacterium]|nr:PDZ domain-containing protein [Xanthomonadales bacterium]
YPVSNAQEFHNYEGQFPVGEELALEIVRDKSDKTLEVEVLELASLDGEAVDYRLTGGRFEELPLKQRTTRFRGVLLSRLEPDSLLARRGLRPGDIITGCNRVSIQDLEEFKVVIESVRGSLFLEVRREGSDYVVRLD